MALPNIDRINRMAYGVGKSCRALAQCLPWQLGEATLYTHAAGDIVGHSVRRAVVVETLSRELPQLDLVRSETHEKLAQEMPRIQGRSTLLD